MKSDDAPAPVHLFDLRVLEAFPFIVEMERNRCETRVRWVQALETLRRFCLRVWKRKVRREFVAWLKKRRKSTTDRNENMVKLGWDACRRVDEA